MKGGIGVTAAAERAMGPHVAPAVAHMGVVMVLALFGNLLLILVLWKGGGGTRRRISPVQVR